MTRRRWIELSVASCAALALVAAPAAQAANVAPNPGFEAISCGTSPCNWTPMFASVASIDPGHTSASSLGETTNSFGGGLRAYTATAWPPGRPRTPGLSTTTWQRPKQASAGRSCSRTPSPPPTARAAGWAIRPDRVSASFAYSLPHEGRRVASGGRDDHGPGWCAVGHAEAPLPEPGGGRPRLIRRRRLRPTDDGRRDRLSHGGRETPGRAGAVAHRVEPPVPRLPRLSRGWSQPCLRRPPGFSVADRVRPHLFRSRPQRASGCHGPPLLAPGDTYRRQHDLVRPSPRRLGLPLRFYVRPVKVAQWN